MGDAGVKCTEYEQWVAADLDDALGSETEGIRRHVAECARCGRLRASQSEVRSLLRSRSLAESAPAALRTRVVATIDEEVGRRSLKGAGAAFRWTALAVAASAALWLAIRTEGPFEPAMESYHLALRGRLSLEVQTANAPELEAFYASRRSAGVPSHVVDLSPAGFRLLGGVMRQVGDRTVRLTLYSDGRSSIVCDFRRPDAYDGPMPETGKPVTFTGGGLSFVVQRMGDEICILASRMPLRRMVAVLTGA